MGGRTTFKASDLAKIGIPHRSRGWATGNDILSNGWDESKVLPLYVRGGASPILDDGNKRVAYLANHGGGEMQIPVQIEILDS